MPPRPRERRPARTSRSTSSSSGLEVYGTTGYARFQSLNFITYGIQASYEVTPNIAVIGGLEAYTTKRTLPSDEVEEGQPASAWNTILPLSLGAIYRPQSSALEQDAIRPFFGGGIQLIPGYVKQGGGMAFGLRAMGGVDYGISDTIGVHATAGTGFWAGSSWYLIEGLMNTGFIIQTSVGAVMLF